MVIECPPRHFDRAADRRHFGDIAWPSERIARVRDATSYAASVVRFIARWRTGRAIEGGTDMVGQRLYCVERRWIRVA